MSASYRYTSHSHVFQSHPSTVLPILILLTHSSEALHILITKPASRIEEPSQYPRIHLHLHQHAQASLTGCTSPKSRMQGQHHSRTKAIALSHGDQSREAMLPVIELSSTCPNHHI
ncbi:uncharacterized protein HD556DRAFT_802089 [Suillus plorans]|uniref:Uncharacterized protein n=1 Tax=Suillus plorans TaxID=116603 RepID=A0A9P7J4J2_9AGAM|nr:uncharacterized protein HD556DRAFT_802089 [Suillus plorans]KAG1802139.1 hypothetical protein HD556DRAFT_802089 [Suillus plorans]